MAKRPKTPPPCRCDAYLPPRSDTRSPNAAVGPLAGRLGPLRPNARGRDDSRASRPDVAHQPEPAESLPAPTKVEATRRRGRPNSPGSWARGQRARAGPGTSLAGSARTVELACGGESDRCDGSTLRNMRACFAPILAPERARTAADELVSARPEGNARPRIYQHECPFGRMGRARHARARCAC
jgi:hypothetical protein